MFGCWISCICCLWCIVWLGWLGWWWGFMLCRMGSGLCRWLLLGFWRWWRWWLGGCCLGFIMFGWCRGLGRRVVVGRGGMISRRRKGEVKRRGIGGGRGGWWDGLGGGGGRGVLLLGVWFEWVMGVKCKMVNRGGMRYRENGFWGFGFCIYIWDLLLLLLLLK